MAALEVARHGSGFMYSPQNLISGYLIRRHYFAIPLSILTVWEICADCFLQNCFVILDEPLTREHRQHVAAP